MARYTADPTQDTAGFEVLPKGDYRLRLGEPKAFSGETREGANKGQKNFGVAFLCTVINGPVDEQGNTSPQEQLSKKIYNRLYYHTQDSRNYSKGFILAAFGYTQKEEKMFNDAINKLKEEDPENPAVDWSFDSETGEVGQAWRSMTNSEVVASLSVEKNNKGDEQQKWDQVRPAPTFSGEVVETITKEDVGEIPAEVLTQ